MRTWWWPRLRSKLLLLLRGQSRVNDVRLADATIVTAVEAEVVRRAEVVLAMSAAVSLHKR